MKPVSIFLSVVLLVNVTWPAASAEEEAGSAGLSANDAAFAALTTDDPELLELQLDATEGRRLLFGAARLGATKIAAELLGRDIGPDAVDEEGLTPLHTAVLMNNLGVAQILLDAGADPTVKDKNSETVFDYIDVIDDGEVKDRLLKLELQHFPGKRLLESVQIADHANIGRTLDAGADPNTEDATGWTPLMYAVDAGDSKAMELLIGSGAELRALPDGPDLLSFAVLQENVEAVRVLLDTGLDPDEVARPGEPRPLTAAILSQQPEMVELLIEHGASKKALSGEAATPAQLAAYVGMDEVAEMLGGAGPARTHEAFMKYAASDPAGFAQMFKSQADDDEVQRLTTGAGPDGWGETVFHIIAMHGEWSDLETLIEHADDVPITTNDNGESFLSVAIIRFDRNIVRTLKDSGFSSDYHTMLDQTDNNGNTVLHRAVLAERQFVAYAVARDGDPTNLYARNKDGLTPIEIAILMGNRDIVEGLVVWYQSARGLPETESGVSVQSIARANERWDILAELPDDMIPPVQLHRDSSKEDRKKLQRWLKSLGYYEGPIDGLLGGGSAAAMRALLRDRKREIEKVAGGYDTRYARSYNGVTDSGTSYVGYRRGRQTDNPVLKLTDWDDPEHDWALGYGMRNWDDGFWLYKYDTAEVLYLTGNGGWGSSKRLARW